MTRVNASGSLIMSVQVTAMRKVRRRRLLATTAHLKQLHTSRLVPSLTSICSSDLNASRFQELSMPRGSNTLAEVKVVVCAQTSKHRERHPFSQQCFRALHGFVSNIRVEAEGAEEGLQKV
eukprot:1157302-Pelagomonas_calceolata.AAC.1